MEQYVSVDIFLPHRELKLILVRSQMHDYFWLFLNRGLYRELFL